MNGSLREIDSNREESKKVNIYYPKNCRMIRLANMDTKMMKKYMSIAKIYIDFGNHPGKDRIPREACMCGCIVITSLEGSAKNDLDILTPFKFDVYNEDLNIKFKTINEIQNLVNDILLSSSRYEYYNNLMIPYRNKIINEKSIFKEEINEMFS